MDPHHDPPSTDSDSDTVFSHDAAPPPVVMPQRCAGSVTQPLQPGAAAGLGPVLPCVRQVAQPERLQHVPRGDVRKLLGLQCECSELFAVGSDMEHLLGERTRPMRPELTKRGFERVTFEELRKKPRVFVGASGAGKTVRMLQAALDEAWVHAAVYCRLPNMSLDLEKLSKFSKGERNWQVREFLLQFLRDNKSVFLRPDGTRTVALLIDDCGVCPDFVEAVAAKFAELRLTFLKTEHCKLIVIAAGTTAVLPKIWSGGQDAFVMTVGAPSGLRQDLEKACPGLKLFGRGKWSKWYNAMMLNSRAATCLARSFKDVGQGVAQSENVSVDWLAPALFRTAAANFKSMSGFAIFDTNELRQLHCRAAWLHSNGVSDTLGENDIQLVRSYGILTDEWAAKDQERHPRYVMDAASHVVLLLCCGGLANALADTGEEFEAEALVWLRWCIALGDAVGDTAEAAKEHTHFNSMFRCNTPSAPFIAPTTPAMQRTAERLRKIVPPASFIGRHHKSRTVKTFVLKHRIDPTFLDQLPRKLVAVGASDVAASFDSETKTKCWTLADVAVALSRSQMHTPSDQDDDHLPIALMQAVLDTSDDVWIFQNPSGEFADIIVVWSNAVWLIKVKHHKQSTDYPTWQMCYEEHKMGSGTVEADCAACVSATNVHQLKSNGYSRYCRGKRVQRASLFTRLLEDKAPGATFERVAPGVAGDLDQSARLVQFLFGAREVRRAHLLYTEEPAIKQPTTERDDYITEKPTGVVPRELASGSLMLHGPKSDPLRGCAPVMQDVAEMVECTGNGTGGLENVGNSCYAGAVLSLLCQDSTIRNAVRSVSVSVGNCESSVFQALLGIMDGSLDTPEPLLEGTPFEDKGNKQQHDAYDFLVALLERIREAEETMMGAGAEDQSDGNESPTTDEGCKRGRPASAATPASASAATPQSGERPSQRGPMRQVAAVSGEDPPYHSPNTENEDAADSLSQLLQGSVIETTKCQTCDEARSATASFTCLSVPCERSVAESVSAFTAVVKSICHCRGAQVKRIGFASLPTKLLIRLERFQRVRTEFGEHTFKNDLPVSVEKTLRLFETTPDATQVPREYSLTGVVPHHGSSLETGHYTARVRCDDQKWYQINDHVVSTASAPDRASNSYILLYTRVPPRA